MLTLSSLTNSSLIRKKVQRVGRGIGSKRGKTSCRGIKGDKSRRGYKAHLGKEGGQLPLYRKLPTRGFTNRRFAGVTYCIDLGQINHFFSDGELVNRETLYRLGYLPKASKGVLKVLGKGSLDKSVRIEADLFSEGAVRKMQERSIFFKVASNKS